MAAKADVTFSIPAIDVMTIDLGLIGETPLIVHAWSEKAKREMLQKQTKEAKAGKAAKDPWDDFQQSLYRMEDEASGCVAYGFPSVAFKAAAVTACTSVDGITKVAARQAFHVVGEQYSIKSAYLHEGKQLSARYDLVKILCPNGPEMREDMVRIGMGTADIRYRGQFWPWAVKVRIKFNAGVLSQAQIVNLFNTAGFGVGIGEWRPEKDGSNGRFQVASEGDLDGFI